MPMKKQPTLFGFWRGSFWTLLVLTLWLSLVPVNQLPPEFHFWDKAQHALGFAALAFLGLLSYPGRTRQLMFGLTLFGVGIECAQELTGWRQGDWADWVADCVGLLIGRMVWRLTFLLVRKRR